MADSSKAQQLFGSNVSVSIGEALQARIANPLWMLARQWQSGEFEAENGGSPIALVVSGREYSLAEIHRGEQVDPIMIADPLDVMVETESSAGDSPAWRSEALEYAFALRTAKHQLKASEYHGRGLDWFHFDVTSAATSPTPPAVKEQGFVPTALQFRGMPHPRWWRFEDGDANFERSSDPEPNLLSTLLPEFTFIDSNNWYVAPWPQTAGTISELESVKIRDGFGHVTVLHPANQSDDAWCLFAMAPVGVSNAREGALFVPNIAIDVLDNDEVEDVLLMRDEDANLVWAVENLYTDQNGVTIRQGDPAPQATPGSVGNSGPPPSVSESAEPTQFHFVNELPRYWIPYLPRLQSGAGGAPQTYLRRGRTDEQASVTQPQYRAKLLAESWRLLEEEIPRSGLRVRRIRRFARGSDGQAHQWIGRFKDAAPRSQPPGLKNDFVT